MHRACFRSLAVGLALFAGTGARAESPVPLAMRPLLLHPVPSPIAAPPSPLGPGQQCRLAIRAAERAAGIPHQLMAAIGRVESGRREPDGTLNPWPWSINAEGDDHVFETKAEAIAAVRALQAKGMRSIDVGCMQVNLLHHPNAFATLEQAFDPVANADYAARFLVQLHDETGAWPTATAWYHSATPELGADYLRRVMAVWPEEQKLPEDPSSPSQPTGQVASLVGSFGRPNGMPRVSRNVVFAARAEPAHIIPLPAGAVGRSLAAYRAAPIVVVARSIGSPG